MVKSRTTLILFAVVALMGAYIWFVERKVETTDQKKEAARRALRIEPDNVTRFSIVSEQLQVTCALEDKRWQIISPVRARADEVAVGNFLSALGGLSRAEVITESEQKELGLSPDTYGLTVPRVRIELDQKQQTMALRVGRDAPLGGLLYLQVEGRREIISTETNLLSALPSAVTDLRDRRIFRGQPNEVTRLDIKRSDGFLQVSRDREGEWLIQKPVNGRASASAVQHLLDRMFDQRVADFVADSVAAFSLYGLDEPVAQVTVVAEASGREQTLILGTEIETNTNEMYASILGSSAVYAVDKSLLEAIRIPLDNLRDRRLLSLAAHEIGYIRLEEGEETLVLQSTNTVEWSVVEPRQYLADRTQVDLLMSDWTGLRVSKFFDDLGTNSVAAPFTSSYPSITFARQSPSDTVRTVTFEFAYGPSSNGFVKVREAGAGAVFEIAEGPAAALSMDPLSYRDRTLVQIDPSQVRSLQVSVPAGSQLVQREGTNDFRGPVSNVVVDTQALLDKQELLRQLRAENLIEEDSKDLGRFGLKAPAGTLVIGLSGAEGIAKTVIFGNESPDGNVYAMVKGQDVVFTISKAVRDKLLSSLYIVPSSQANSDDIGTTAETNAP